jgi:hypothetical protein
MGDRFLSPVRQARWDVDERAEEGELDRQHLVHCRYHAETVRLEQHMPAHHGVQGVDEPVIGAHEPKHAAIPLCRVIRLEARAHVLGIVAGTVFFYVILIGCHSDGFGSFLECLGADACIGGLEPVVGADPANVPAPGQL